MTATAEPKSTQSGEGIRALTASDIAARVGGTLVGDGSARVTGVAALDRAGSNDLTFLASAKYAPLFGDSAAGVVLVSPELADTQGAPRTRIVVAKPHDALVELLPLFYRSVPREPGVHPTARLGRGVALGADVTIGAYAVIEDQAVLGDRVWVDAHCVVGRNVVIGEDSRLYAGVTLYPGAEIGKRVAIHSGARIGCDGFGYVFRNGAHEKIPHVGRCIVGDDIEIGANTTIDRGSIDDTVIGAGTKIDNLVHIGHNTRIGRLCLIMAQVGIAGSTRVGDGVILAGQVGLSGHLSVGDRARLGAQAGVFGDIPAGEEWSGYPARPHRESLRAHAALFKLSGLVKQIERLLAGKGEGRR